MTPPTSRLSSEDRRVQILEAAIPVFAEKGFQATTTRDLAKAAEISEALLYKHFPSKEALFDEIQQRCACGGADEENAKRFEAMPDSTEKLVFGVHVLVHMIVLKKDLTFSRLMANSLVSDGDFARQFLKNARDSWGPMFEGAFKAARARGDLSDQAADPMLAVWFTHHVAVMTVFQRLPKKPGIDYGVESARLAEQAVRFALRGIGLKDEAIARWYDPAKFKALSLTA